MYEYINGKITAKNPAYITIETGGLAYRINISLNTYDQIVKLSECKLLLHLQIKEDAHSLFGFFKEDEREMFRALISISGIGANTAILILSSLKTPEIRNAIISSNLSLLKSIKGVGPKTAQRMIIELQDSFKKGGSNLPSGIAITGDSTANEAISALVMLGFKKAEAEKAVFNIIRNQNETLKVEDIVKLSLKQL